MRTTIIRNVPQWAVQYLEDPSNKEGLLDDDVKKIEDFKAKLAREHLSLLCPRDGTENEFCSCPAFGLAAATVDYIAEVIAPKWEVKFTETQECVVLAEGYTKKEARANAEKYLESGCLNWQSSGIKFKSCRPAGTEVAYVKEGDEK